MLLESKSADPRDLQQKIFRREPLGNRKKPFIDLIFTLGSNQTIPAQAHHEYILSPPISGQKNETDRVHNLLKC